MNELRHLKLSRRHNQFAEGVQRRVLMPDTNSVLLARVTGNRGL